MIKALLMALLEPTKPAQTIEARGDHTSRLAMLEEMKTLPFGAVWDYYCTKSNVPAGDAWLSEVKAYEENVLSTRM
jgi:L-rhamnose isomerase